MGTSFKLRKGKKVNTILVDLRYGRNIRVRCSTSISIKKGSEKYWNAKKGRIKIPNDIHNASKINEKLIDYEVQFEKAIQDLEINGGLTQTNCCNSIKKILKRDKSTEEGNNAEDNSKSNNVIEYFDWYINFYSTKVSPHTKKTLTAGTIKTYKNCKLYFEKYLKARNKKAFFFEDFDKDFYYDFIDYGEKKGYSLNYIGSMIQKLKTIISSAYDNGNHKNLEFKLKYFSKLTEEINHPYLNKEELEKIDKLNLKDDFLNDVRDIFLIACNTGLRVGDLTAFLKKPVISKLKDKDCIHIKQQKTGNEVYIPLNSMVKQILKRRNNQFPNFIHPNILNEALKRIVKRAKINEDFTIVKTIKGVKTNITKPKYKLISMHSARRSFCSNAYNDGMPPHHIMIFSGHKSEKVFHNYIKTSIKKKAELVADHSFFN